MLNSCEWQKPNNTGEETDLVTAFSDHVNNQCEQSYTHNQSRKRLPATAFSQIRLQLKFHIFLSKNSQWIFP